MPIVAGAWSAAIVSSLSAKGMSGSKMSNFANAVGTGSAQSLIGKSFSTTDTGAVPGAGMGSGVGIQGVPSSTIKSAIYASCVGTFGQGGPSLMDFADAVASACVQMLQQATLSSTHGPIFTGNATIVVGSISVSPSEWSNNIKSAGSIMQGAQWANFSKALGEAQANAIKAGGTGNLAIAGAPASPTPSPGSGVGTGTIS
jgi:hypothetical protein